MSTGVFLAGMPGWPRVTRRPTQQVIGKSLYEIFPDVRNTRLPGIIEDAFQVGSSSILTHTLNTLLPLQGEGGEPILHNIVVRPVSAEHANYCLLQITDVTVAVTRERVLRERQNARYHAIVDSAPDAIITIDDNRVIQWVNGAVDHVLGYGHAELLGQPLDILLQPDNPVGFRAGGKLGRSKEPMLRYQSSAGTRMENLVTSRSRLDIGAPINAISSRQSGATLRNGRPPMPPCAMHATPCKEVTMNWKAGSRSGHENERSR